MGVACPKMGVAKILFFWMIITHDSLSNYIISAQYLQWFAINSHFQIIPFNPLNPIIPFILGVSLTKNSLCISVHHSLPIYEILCQYLARFKSYRGGRTDRRTDGRTDRPTDRRTKWIVEIPAGSKNHVKFFVFSTLKRVESCPKWV